MTTPTITEFAVQVRWEDDVWTFVMKPYSVDEIDIYPTREAADEAASIWAPGSSRVVSRQITITDWEEVS